MKIIYIAGPYRGDIENNVKAAQEVGDRLAAAGVAFICPHSNGHPHDHVGASDEYWFESTLEIMRRCDGVLLFGAWGLSSGALNETCEAVKIRIPVFYPDQIEDCISWALNNGD